MTYDDLLMSALRITPDDAETPSDVDVDSESGEESEVEADNDASTATEGPEAELEALLRSVDPTRRARNQTTGERLAAFSKKKEDEWGSIPRETFTTVAVRNSQWHHMQFDLVLPTSTRFGASSWSR